MSEKLPRILSKVATSTSLLGSFTCRKFTTWDRRLYFPSEGRRAEVFFARTWVPEASTLTSRTPKPLLDLNNTRLNCISKTNYEIVLLKIQWKLTQVNAPSLKTEVLRHLHINMSLYIAASKCNKSVNCIRIFLLFVLSNESQTNTI